MKSLKASRTGYLGCAAAGDSSWRCGETRSIATKAKIGQRGVRSARRDVRATHPTRTLPGHHPKRPYPAAQVRRAAGRRRTKRAAPRGEGRVLGERRAGRPGRRRDDAARRAAGERVLGGLPAGDPRARHVPGHAGPRHGPFHPPHAEGGDLGVPSCKI